MLVPREQGRCGRREGALSVQLGSQMIPILKTNFKDLSFFYLRHKQHVVEGLGKKTIRAHKQHRTILRIWDLFPLDFLLPPLKFL